MIDQNDRFNDLIEKLFEKEKTSDNFNVDIFLVQLIHNLSPDIIKELNDIIEKSL